MQGQVPGAIGLHHAGRGNANPGGNGTSAPHCSSWVSPAQLTLQWSQTEKTNKSAIQEHKLRVVYLAAEDGTAANGIPEENEDAGEQSRIEESVSVSSITLWIHSGWVLGVESGLTSMLFLARHSLLCARVIVPLSRTTCPTTGLDDGRLRRTRSLIQPCSATRGTATGRPRRRRTNRVSVTTFPTQNAMAGWCGQG